MAVDLATLATAHGLHTRTQPRCTPQKIRPLRPTPQAAGASGPSVLPVGAATWWWGGPAATTRSLRQLGAPRNSDVDGGSRSHVAAPDGAHVRRPAR
ncbi:hypothetical protein GUJ93_ZPchr0005g15132 [Zizania palustris]|uniref:Uncharacterized protein n=1 Tax=Zizania palustris TaxID=103762 RepID=A0A8J5S3F2_ZIZPA|nr:hypothetical protein GUJ93_ZPchr0005g15132 [Zizania palustris]